MAEPRLDQVHVHNPQQRVTGAEHLCLQVALGRNPRDISQKVSHQVMVLLSDGYSATAMKG